MRFGASLLHPPTFAILKPAVDNTRVDASPYEYRMKWYGEDEATAKAKASELRALQAKVE